MTGPGDRQAASTALRGDEREAATLVVFRDPGTGPEVLMIRRSSRMAFAGGAFVFPGGAVDPDDHALAAAWPGSPAWNAARVAAVRETLEETGLLIGIDRPVTAADAMAARADLLAGMTFPDLLSDRGWTIAHEDIVPFARWVPPIEVPRRFDTRFFIADLGSGAVDLCADGTETTDHVWARPDDFIAQADAGEVQVIFPTRMNLLRLGALGSFAAARAALTDPEPPIVETELEHRDGKLWIGVAEGFGYPTGKIIEDTVPRS